MHDIRNRSDVEKLVNRFYEQVMTDPLIGVFFTEIVQLDLEKHMPVMFDFWESVLFYTASYRGNPMEKHIVLSGKKRLEAGHFDRWLELWQSTVDELYEGPKANEAKAKAMQIGRLMQVKINETNV